MLLLIGCNDYSYSECLITGIKEAHTDHAVSLLREACEMRAQSVLPRTVTAEITGSANAENPFKDKVDPPGSSTAGKSAIEEDFKTFLRGRVKFSLTIKNESYDWRLTGLTIRIVLDKAKKVSETHVVHMTIDPGQEVKLTSIEIQQLAEIKKGNWAWEIISIRGIRLTPASFLDRLWYL